MVTRQSTVDRWRSATALAGAAWWAIPANASLAQESAGGGVWSDPVGRTRVLLASLALLVVSLGMIYLVWWAGRVARSFTKGDLTRRGPSGKVGPSDWRLAELAPIGRQSAGPRESANDEESEDFRRDDDTDCDDGSADD